MIIHSDLSGAAQAPTTMDLLDKGIKCRSGARTPTACLICLLFTFSNTASGRNTHPSGFKCAKFCLVMLLSNSLALLPRRSSDVEALRGGAARFCLCLLLLILAHMDRQPLKSSKSSLTGCATNPKCVGQISAEA